MRIADIKIHPVPMKGSRLSEGLIANPMSIYPEYREKRQSWYGPMTSAIVEISTDAGDPRVLVSLEAARASWPPRW